jgi:predicted kinase
MSWKFKYYDVESGPMWDAIEKHCGWFQDMKAVPQDKIWHAEGDVQIHTKMVCEALIALPEFKSLSEQEKHIMFVGALMHDIEKRSTTTEEFKNGRLCIVAPKHAERGEVTAREILYKEFDCPYQVRELICKVVKWHGKPLHTVSEKVMINLATQVPPYWLAMIAKADILGRICEDAVEQLEKTEFFNMLAEDLGCLKGPREFADEMAEFTYLSKGGYLEYVPFDETKFEVVMMSALPGSGKDTYIANNLKGWGVVSLDDIRIELGVKPTDKSGNGRVIQLAKERAKEFMRKHENFVWNATNITAQMRGQLIDLFMSYGGKVTIVYVEVPYKTLISQNNNRDAAVPNNVIDKMIGKLEPPVREEAHRVVFYLDCIVTFVKD